MYLLHPNHRFTSLRNPPGARDLYGASQGDYNVTASGIPYRVFGRAPRGRAAEWASPISPTDRSNLIHGLKYAEKLSGRPFTAAAGARNQRFLALNDTRSIPPPTPSLPLKHSHRTNARVGPGLHTAPGRCREDTQGPQSGQMRWSLPRWAIPDEALTSSRACAPSTRPRDDSANVRWCMGRSLRLRDALAWSTRVSRSTPREIPRAGGAGRGQGLRFTNHRVGLIRVRAGARSAYDSRVGVIFKVEPVDGPARAYVCENYGGQFTLPHRGPIRANCLAQASATSPIWYTSVRAAYVGSGGGEFPTT